jgi:hypothetical protein
VAARARPARLDARALGHVQERARIVHAVRRAAATGAVCWAALGRQLQRDPRCVRAVWQRSLGPRGSLQPRRTGGAQNSRPRLALRELLFLKARAGGDPGGEQRGNQRPGRAAARGAHPQPRAPAPRRRGLQTLVFHSPDAYVWEHQASFFRHLGIRVGSSVLLRGLQFLRLTLKDKTRQARARRAPRSALRRPPSALLPPPRARAPRRRAAAPHRGRPHPRRRTRRSCCPSTCGGTPCSCAGKRLWTGRTWWCWTSPR